MYASGCIYAVIVFAARKLGVTCVVLPDMTSSMSDAMSQLFLNHFTPPLLHPVNTHCCLSPCVAESSILFPCHILFLAATHGSACCNYTYQQLLLSIITHLPS
ncbi:hypothetical protein COCC4DRAFT_63239 [Bipolaris maydis ATCC 48331]|uniref:Uncharacterized protein n=2 Tax=Cochliobolus heterostrophus TaxID=5016 RepID=M2UGY5_COCH5|nr:uncharacterized protein COCC4DRAFT_63239 [Bipolaris maydis ATCC 48331]EMD97714.1 hypothetical protein COCHEDRAFT_1086168 [Bipolaris maydis C5]ENI02890.1 hypothetical protein COCC4DRAFT_63239 [Bipolaris maydis ATCC 48331]